MKKYIVPTATLLDISFDERIVADQCWSGVERTWHTFRCDEYRVAVYDVSADRSWEECEHWYVRNS